jgi:hypothetical protein
VSSVPVVPKVWSPAQQLQQHLEFVGLVSSGSYPNLRNQKLEGQNFAIQVLARPPGDSEALSRTTALWTSDVPFDLILQPTPEGGGLQIPVSPPA